MIVFFFESQAILAAGIRESTSIFSIDLDAR